MNEIRFQIAGGLDTIPVAAEPYGTVVARCLHALGRSGHNDETAPTVRMCYFIHMHLMARRLVETVRFDDQVCDTFLGRKIEFDHCAKGCGCGG